MANFRLNPLQTLLSFFTITGILFSSFAQPVFAAAPATEGAPADFFVAAQPLAAEPRPLSAPSASVGLGMPASVFLGENFSFTVTFDNTGIAPGYGPFVDLVFPVTGGDGDGDGVDFISATYLGTAVETVVNVFPNSGGGLGCVAHPYARDNTGALIQVCGTAGDKLVTLRLPFGSFVPDQPAISITINATLHPFANFGENLTVRARGGYMFGATPLDDWCCGDTPIISHPNTDSATWPGSSITPTVMTFSKSYTGPKNTEAETATGPNFIRQYVLRVDVAENQTLTNLDLTDLLPNTAQFVRIDPNPANTTPGYSVIAVPSTSTPGGALTLRYASVTGTASTEDIIVTIDFYVPRLDSNNASVLSPTTGDFVSVENKAEATAQWTPSDPDDPPALFSEGGVCPTCPPLNTLRAKSIALQKGVGVVGGGNPAPTQTLLYTLEFQISDFFAFDGLVITDVVSDGQRVDSTYIPELSINGNGYTLAALDMSGANYDIACNYTGTAGAECTIDNTAVPNDGTTTLTFNVSNEIITRGQNGRMIGGCVDSGGAGYLACTAAPFGAGATTGTITFRTIIQQEFTDDFPSGDSSVDQGDVLGNTAVINGNVLNINSFAPIGVEGDNATAGVSIGRDVLVKSIYAINDSTALPTDTSGNITIKPGDKVTFRLSYGLPTSNVENLTFDDFFPLPVFDVTDANSDGVAGPNWTFDPTATGFPAPGVVQLHASDTFYAYMTSGLAGATGTLTANPLNTAPAQAPVITADAAANKIVIAYADYDDTRNQATTVDLLFSVIVSDDPFADGLFLTNQAHAFEGSTNGGQSTANSIVQFVLTEPLLVTTKSAVWAGSWNGASWDAQPNAVIAPPVTPAFTNPGTSPRWAGTILDATTVNGDITNVDAGDAVTFAIVIENQGSSTKGAFDISIVDTLISAIFETPTGSAGAYPLNLQIHLGDGVGVDYTGDGLPDPIQFTGLGGGPSGLADASDDIFGNGIRLVDPIDVLPTGTAICQGHTIGAGKNVIVITYDLYIKAGVTPGEYINTATNTSYAGENNGPNHVPTPGPGQNYPDHVTDTASTTVLGSLAKSLVSTQINNANNADPQVVVGERVTYQLTSTVPEGTVPGAFITDRLDGGLAYVSCTSVTASAGVTTDLASGNDFSGVCASNVTVTNSGQDIRFDLGNITNTNRDNTIAETVTITYDVVVLNVNGNQGGTLLNNAAEFFMNDGAVASLGTANASNVTVIEPTITTAKSVNPTSTDAGNVVTYTVTLTNGNGALDTDAYDVLWSDTLPAGVTYVGGSLTLGVCPNPPDTLSAAAAPLLTATWDNANAFPKNSSCQIQFQATVDYTVNPGNVVRNTALTAWTSMPGLVTDVSSHNPADSDERTGADGVGTGLNNYASTGFADLIIVNPSVEKYIVDTSEVHTAEPVAPFQPGQGGAPNLPAAIGEIIRYRLVTSIPEGTSPNFQVSDRLPNGLIFLNDDTAQISFVSNGGITSTGVDSIPAIPAGCNSIGNTANGAVPAALLCTLADANIGSTMSTTVNVDSYSSGTDVFFKLGTLVNNDSDADLEFVVIELNAIVHNSATHQNNAGETKSNQGRTYINGSVIGNDSAAVNVHIVEPSLTIDKYIVTPATDAGDPMVYRLSITNNAAVVFGAANAAPAFDLELTDTLNTYLDLLNVAVYVDGSNGSTLWAGVCASTPQNFTNNSVVGVGGTVAVDFTCLNPGETVTVDITAQVVNNAPAGYVIPNTARITGTSLPGGAGGVYASDGNSTGSDVPGNPGASNGERDGSGGITSTLNDHIAEDTINHTLAVLSADKRDASPTQYTIGEQVTFDILVTLAEGVNRGLVVVDDLPVGLSYVSHQLVTTAAASGSLLTADFAGALPAPTVTATGGSGADLTLTFGDTTVFADNDPLTNTFQVRVVALVLNINPPNIDGTVLTNLARITYTNPNTGASVTVTDSTTINVIEPRIATVKSVLPTSSVQAGDVVAYTVRFTNTGNSTAYDVTALDTLSQGVAYNNGSAACVDNTTAVVAVAVTDGGTTLTFDGSPAGAWDIPVNGWIECTYTVTAQPGLYMAGNHTNTIDADWTSLNGTNADERNYNDSGSIPFDGLQDQDDAVFSSDAPTLAKDDNNVTQVVIGDTITFTLHMGGELGTYRDVVIIDHLPAGLIYNNDAVLSGFSVSPAPTVTSPNDGTAAVTITWTFGDVYKSAADATITYTARVANVSGNIDTTVLINDVRLNYDQADGTSAIQLTDTESSTIVEPQITTVKTASPTSGIQAGNTVTYTTRFTNTGTSTAFEVTAQDVLPANVTYNADAACMYHNTATTTPIPVTVSGTTTLALGTWDIPVGHYVECTYSITTQGDIALGISHVNTVDADWSSQDGNNVNERIYDDAVTSPVDDGTQDTDTASFDTSTPTALNKSDGGVTQVMIGEVIHITITINSPLGALSSTSVVDVLPAGMVYAGGQTVNGNITAPTFSVSSPNDGTVPVTLTWDFGNAIVSGNPIVIEYDARAANVAGNVDGTNLINDVTFNFTDAGGPQSLNDTDDVRVIEPVLLIDKSVDDPYPAEGQLLTFTLRVEHSAASTSVAHDLRVTDSLPVGLDGLNVVSIVPSDVASTFTDNSTGNDLDITIDVLPMGEHVLITFEATVTAAFTDSMTNQARVTWTSIAGTSADERTGAGGINDYEATDTQNFNVWKDVAKNIIDHNHAPTLLPEVVIGEILTYELRLSVAPGTDSYVLTDTLDIGLVFIDCRTDITADAGITSDALLFNTQANCAPVVSNAGQTVVFDLGNVTNANASTGEIVITYDVAVLDTLDNLDGVGGINNIVRAEWTFGNATDSASPVEVVEPDLLLEKAVSHRVVVPGQWINYSLRVAHTTDSTAHAYDLLITDILPRGVTPPAGGPVPVTASGRAFDRYAYNPVTRALTIEWDEMLFGEEAVVTFAVQVGSLAAGSSVTNIASLTWTSLPGIPAEYSGQPTGVQSPHNPRSTERFYDPSDPANFYGVDSSVVFELPATGFAPGRVTRVAEQPESKAYNSVGSIVLEIPSIGVETSIVGVPIAAQSWDLTWLWDQAGYLEGTAFPTWKGNTALTGHVYLPDGNPGPFVNLHTLYWGNQIILRTNGLMYVYEVRSVRKVLPNDLSVLGHKDRDWLTLITCQSYNERTDSYQYRIAVQAVLIKIQPDK